MCWGDSSHCLGSCYVVEKSSQRLHVCKCPRLGTNGVRCCVLLVRQRVCVRVYVQMLNHLASVAASDSSVGADSFVIGVLDAEEGGGGLHSTAHPRTMGRVSVRVASLCDVGESMGLKAQELASEVARIGVADSSLRQKHHCLSRLT